MAPLPEATLVSSRRSLWPWLLPLLTLALVIYLLRSVRSESGIKIEMEFDSGFGIGPDDPLKFRGIEVGRVLDVRLIENNQGVRVQVELAAEAASLARAGTRFWIARPEIGMSGVSGLETLFGPKYIAALPGPSDAGKQLHFKGLEAAPIDPPFEGGLEIVLEGATRGGISAGAPLLFRQVPVGRVLSVALSSDATVVEMRAVVAPEFSELVRENSRFWQAAGLRASAGLFDGFELEIESLEGLLTGAVAFATPSDGGDAAATGRRYALHSEAEESWTAWSPNLPIGSHLLPSGARLPEPTRAALRWKEGVLLPSQKSRVAWTLRLRDGLLGPREVLVAPEEAREGTVSLEVNGEKLFPVSSAEGRDPSAVLILRLPLTDDPKAWPTDHLRVPTQPESILIFGDPAQGVRALDAARLHPAPDLGPAWRIDQEASFSREWHGAAVLARSDGRLIGLLCVHGSKNYVALIP